MAIRHDPSPLLTLPAISTTGGGLLLLAGTKALDALTTAVGLAASPDVVEANALVAAVMRALGVGPALLALSVLTVAVIAGFTESAAHLSRWAEDTPSPAVVRQFGYGVPSALHVGIAVNNTIVLASL